MHLTLLEKKKERIGPRGPPDSKLNKKVHRLKLKNTSALGGENERKTARHLNKVK